MISKSEQLSSEKTSNLKKDWGDISSKECGNEIRKAVMDFENSLIINRSTTIKDKKINY